MTTGEELKAEREGQGVRARDIAACWRADPAVVSRLEQAQEVEPLTAKRYRAVLKALVEQRRQAARQLIRELRSDAADTRGRKKRAAGAEFPAAAEVSGASRQPRT